MVTPYKIKSGVIAFSLVNIIYLILFLIVWFVRLIRFKSYTNR